MSVSLITIIEPKQAENVQTTQYTSTGAKTIIDKFTVTNTTGSPADLSVNLVTLAGTAADSNLILDTKTVASGETYTCPEIIGHSLGSGDFISTLAGTATALTIRANGRLVT
jgi:hypothetical protein